MLEEDTRAAQCNNILIVEDDKGIRELLQIALEVEGYKVFTASNGKEGIEELLRMPRPCLILLDLMMPVMDGWGFVDALESDLWFATIPVIVVTAFRDKSKTIKAKEIIEKPLDLNALCKTIRHYCDPDES
jgi:CheY-like chemotaxis protein